MVIERNGTLICFIDTGDQSQQRAFACPVDPDEAKDGTFLYGQIQSFQNFSCSEVFIYIFNFQHLSSPHTQHLRMSESSLLRFLPLSTVS